MRCLWLLALPFVLSACSLGGGGGSASIEADQLKELVLQSRDLPPTFIRFDEGRQAQADQPVGSRGDLGRFGREDGWKARFRRPGTLRTAGPLVVESRADLFNSAEGASDDLRAQAADLGAEALSWRRLESPALADEAIALTLRQTGAGRGVRFYLVAWREDNVTASVLASGFEGKFTLEHTLDLARKQQLRLAGAVAS
jgi:hypothetical protein